MANKRALTYLFLMAVIVFIFFFQSVEASNLEIHINGYNFTGELDPYQQKGAIMVKARSLAEKIGADISWIKAIKTLQLKKDNTSLKMMVGNPYLQINNKSHKLKNTLQVKDGHTYLPLKEVVEAFGYLFRQEGLKIYITKPEFYLHSVRWEQEGQRLVLEMDNLAPYRITKTDDPRKLILELDKTALAEDFSDGLSNKNFYLKINKVPRQARLKLIIICNYPIPFQRDRGLEEDENKLIINFLPYITSINWKNNSLEIKANGEIEKPQISMLKDPRRLVIDIPGLMLNTFDLELPQNDWVKDIRVSQYKYDPVVLRVVIELKEDKYLNLAEKRRADTLILEPSKMTRILDIKCNDNVIVFRTDHAIKPEIFMLKDPQRLVVNLINAVRNKDVSENIEIDGEVVKRIRTGRFNEETVRIVADLQNYTGHKFKQKVLPGGEYENRIILRNNIEAIEITDLEHRTDININFSGQVKYKVDRLSEPARLVVDVQGLLMDIEDEDLPQPTGIIKDIRVSQFSVKPKIVRFVLELKNYYSHTLFSSNPDNSISISVYKGTYEKRKDIIIIDPGHGGFDPGAIGPSGLQEKDVNLTIAKKVQNLLEAKGQKTLLTRNTDQFISLRNRVKLANNKEGKLFISIHNNAHNKEYSEGTETYYAPSKKGDSRLLAQYLQEELIKGIKRPDRGVKSGNLYVIKYTQMPAALVEVAFISNPHEEALLENALFQQKAARAIVRGIMRYLQKIEEGEEGTDD